MIKDVFAKRKPKNPNQWTNRLASLADGPPLQTLSNKSKDVSTRLAADLEKTGISHKPEKTLSKIHEPINIALHLRLEGPYFTPAEPARYHTVVCLVAGTGVSGAIAVANAFREIERKAAERRNNPLFGQAQSSIHSGDESQDAGDRRASRVAVQNERVWMRCVVLWSVREDSYIPLPDLASKFEIA